MWASASAPPRIPFGPSAASSAIPATAGGSTIGSSTSVITTNRPRNERVARRYAAGVPTTTITRIAIAVVSKLSRSASVAAGSPSFEISSPGEVCVKMAITGSTKNANVTASAAPNSSGNHARRITPPAAARTRSGAGRSCLCR